MRRRRLLWQLVPSYLLLVIFVLVAVTWYEARSLRAFYHKHTATDLQRQGALIEEPILSAMRNNPAGIETLCRDLSARSGMRITIISLRGVVLGDSEEEPRAMENHAGRPEVRSALAGHVGVATRYSHTVRQEMMYVALPLRDHDQTVAIVRTSLPVLSIGRPLHKLDTQQLFAAMVITGIAALLSFLVSSRISRPLEELRRGAMRFASGDLHERLHVTGSEEIASLAQAMNNMAAQLDERISTVLRHRNEQEAILTSMVEGVLAVDMDERLISMNTAAARIFHVEAGQAQGRNIQEIIRNTDLQHFVARTLAGTQPVEGEITLRDGSDRFLLANGTILHDANGKAIGAVVVLNDVTRLRRLEKVRQEFVANVSHELRTPITSIKGFVESLLDGALDEREQAEHFLTVVDKQVDRLNALIEDLLLLSSLEDATERADIGLSYGELHGVLSNALQVCAFKSNAKGITLDLNCDESLSTFINPPLLEQAFINLIDNAIKYSDPGGQVDIDARQSDEELVVCVRDAGCGIGKEHLPRIFERFYRVDKARSRKLGGTGLGLSIVKHIAQAHGGYISVASTVGEGSVFAIHLPLLPPEHDVSGFVTDQSTVGA